MSTNNRHSLSRRVFVTIFSISTAAIVVFAIAATWFMQNRLAETTREELANEAQVVATSLNYSDSDISLLESMGLDDTRVTLVDADGNVIYDSEGDAATMENHADRPEIEDAFATGTGSDERTSSTLGKVMLYEAVLLDDGTVVRLAQEEAGYLSVLSSLFGPLLVIAAVVAIISAIVAKHEADRIIAPLLEVDLDHPMKSTDAYAEMVPMLERIESQRQELKHQVKVLSDNDRMRREFTANVTHELKTPLTAISGYAELIANGMVANEEDQREFGKRIYEESGRMTSLVNDILTLSHLDEAEQVDSDITSDTLGAPELVDLPRLLLSVSQRLDAEAKKNDITVTLDCHPVIIEGVPRLLDEIVYNLANNAIRYNRPGGWVELSCGLDEDNAPFICVADNGIGIAEEEQEKVFERFYRVDKSRSKARGGTGLGLAIVKHAAMFHNATIDMESELDEGTTITVTFPVQQADIRATIDEATNGQGSGSGIRVDNRLNA